MTERLLTKRDLAAMLGTSPGVAVSIMAEHGVYPIYWGAGRSRGYRWLESSVRQAIHAMYVASQPQPKKSSTKPQSINIRLGERSIADVYKLTTCQRVQ